MLALFCASEAHADEAIDARIERAERLLLGKTAGDQPVESRLDAVEMNLYGKTKHGSVVKRMDAISDFLGIKDDGVGKAPGVADPKPQPTDSASRPENSNDSKVDQAKADVAKADASKSDIAKADAAKADASKSDVVKVDAGGVAAQSVSTASPKSDKVDPIRSSTKADRANLSKKFSATSKAAAVSKVGLIPLKPQEAKMATPPVAPKRADTSMPPAAPSIASTMNKTGFNLQARDLLRDGLRQYASGQYREAEDTFRRVLTVDPRNADAFYNLGSLAERNHDYVVALTNYRAALTFNPTDKDYIAAVTAMERQLSSLKPTSSTFTSPTRTATLGHFQVPVDAATSSAPLTASSPIGAATGQPFQLSGTQNDVLMNTTQFNNNNYTPTMNVNQQTPPPTMGVGQQAPKKGGGFGKVMNVGMRAALYSSGLHCPICRMMGGGFHF